jgi:periplasmic protein TonB
MLDRAAQSLCHNSHNPVSGAASIILSMPNTAAMTNAFAEIDAVEEPDRLGLEPGDHPDRLPPMLFLAALVHGILIIGITFNAVLGGESREAISLEVTIVADPERSMAEPEDADYLAQSSQQGSGNTREQVRPSAEPESNMPFDNPGTTDGTRLLDAQTERLAADELLTSRSDTDTRVAEQPREDPMQESATAIALESGAEVTLPLPQDDEANPLIHDDNPRQLVTSVDTRESKVAGYLDRWKRKIEATGVKYFPEEAVLRGHTGSPTLEVTIDASGQLHEVIVRRSSGSKVLDQAAISILQHAAPFDPFPESLRVDYDQLRFAYKWEFRKVDAATAAAGSRTALP